MTKDNVIRGGHVTNRYQRLARATARRALMGEKARQERPRGAIGGSAEQRKMAS